MYIYGACPYGFHFLYVHAHFVTQALSLFNHLSFAIRSCTDEFQITGNNGYIVGRGKRVDTCWLGAIIIIQANQNLAMRVAHATVIGTFFTSKTHL
jgi:hypothetical protein